MRWLAPVLFLTLAAGLPRLLFNVHTFLEAIVQALS
jgi:hypothetical protein